MFSPLLFWLACVWFFFPFFFSSVHFVPSLLLDFCSVMLWFLCMCWSELQMMEHCVPYSCFAVLCQNIPLWWNRSAGRSAYVKDLQKSPQWSELSCCCIIKMSLQSVKAIGLPVIYRLLSLCEIYTVIFHHQEISLKTIWKTKQILYKRWLGERGLGAAILRSFPKFWGSVLHPLHWLWSWMLKRCRLLYL